MDPYKLIYWGIQRTFNWIRANSAIRSSTAVSTSKILATKISDSVLTFEFLHAYEFIQCHFDLWVDLLTRYGK